MATVFVEVLGRRGQIAERVRLERLPAHIGRAYSSEIIVDDAFVSPSHVRVEERPDEGIVLVDTSDANGMIDATSGRRVASLALENEALVQIGGTVLRVRPASFGVEPTRPYPGGATVTPRGWGRHAKTALVVLVCLVFLVWREFLGTATNSTLAENLEESVGWVFLLFVWTGCWAFASRALAHESFFGRHLRIACAGIVTLPIWDTALSYAAFFLSFDSQPSITSTIGGTLISAVVVYHHLSLVSRQSRRRRQLIAAGLASLVIATALISEVASHDDFSWYPNHSSLLKPIPSALLSARDPQILFDSAAELRDRVEELAAVDLE